VNAPYIIVLYGNPFTLNNETVYPYLIVKAKNNFDYYSHYHYCTVNVSLTPIQLNNRIIFNQDNSSEWLTRFRRTVHFSDASDLTPVDFNHKDFGRIRKKLEKIDINCDHVTYWKSKNGTCFILIEPYHQNSQYKSILKSVDLSVEIIISEFSPYSGGWENEIGKQASTRSYLICDSNNEEELWDVTSRILSSSIGRGTILKDFYLEDIVDWNSLTGINYV
jgi:hypothetical protein